MLSKYHDEALTAERIAKEGHRNVVGGMWEEIGELQLGWLKDQGLQPHHTLLDIGCGSLRLGLRAVDYLDSSRYWGTDLSQDLLAAGYEQEIVPAGLASKLPRDNLIVDSEFTFDGVPTKIDFVMAQSVFTHLPLNHIRLCLANLSRHVEKSCVFFFTILTPDPARTVVDPCVQAPGVVSYSHKDPYHYLPGDIEHVATEWGWKIEVIGDWGHPRKQKMVAARLNA